MSLENYMLPCLSKTLFGFECMGCGFQRSLLLIWKGQFIEAFYMYAAIYPILVLSAYIIITRFYKFKNYKKGINWMSILSITTIILSYTIKHL
jgi:hypothetical protein|tara:strand:- start:732 stop:1010 length:279 start_codon:yes stop_codon:yes gene_type:complete